MEEGIGNRSVGIRPLESYGEDESPAQFIKMPDAPRFPGDETRANCRAPSYSQWAFFCHDTGLYSLFHNKTSGLMKSHPGMEGFTEEHVRVVRKALAAYQKANPRAMPGWVNDDEDDGARDIALRYDGNLARLIWLEWWMSYALKNFENPGIYNS